MSKFSGLVLVLVGVGIAAYAMPPASNQTEATVDAETVVAKHGTPPVITVATAPSPAVAEEPAIAAALPPKPRPAPRPSRASQAQPAATTVVTVARPVESTATKAFVQPPKSAPLPDRASLARELQRELRRVGCYEGEINGAWTNSTRRAMKTFTDRVNATLPTEVPDYILLSLLRSHPEEGTCASCPAGQGLEEGRCVPHAILAKNAKRHPAPTRTALETSKQPANSAHTAERLASNPNTIPHVAATAPPEGRMALAGPSQESAPVHAREKEKVRHHHSARVRRARLHHHWYPPAGVYARAPRYAVREAYGDPWWGRRLVFRPPPY
jgi:hypothetical protein